MPDPIEENSGGMDAAILLASVADAAFNSPPDDETEKKTNQSAEERGVRWAAWVRDMLVAALNSVEKRGRSKMIRLPAKPNPAAFEAARKALSGLAPHIDPGRLSRKANAAKTGPR